VADKGQGVVLQLDVWARSNHFLP